VHIAIPYSTHWALPVSAGFVNRREVALLIPTGCTGLMTPPGFAVLSIVAVLLGRETRDEQLLR
jgi:hypothetical protein